MFKKLKVRLKSITSMIHHNRRLADPLDEVAKQLAEISGKKKKTEADHKNMAHIEFVGGMHLGVDGLPIIPAEMIEATVINAAKTQRKGATYKTGITCEDIKLEYKGPKNPEKMWAQSDDFSIRVGVRIGNKVVMRTRPMFKQWEGELVVHYDDEIITSKKELVSFIRVAGRQIGIGDWRPKFGRFEVVA